MCGGGGGSGGRGGGLHDCAFPFLELFIGVSLLPIVLLLSLRQIVQLPAYYAQNYASILNLQSPRWEAVVVGNKLGYLTI